MTKKIVTGMIFSSIVFLSFQLNVHSAVEGNVYEWQMKKYEWTQKEFPDMVEDNLANKEDIRSKNSEELHNWQMNAYQWTQDEFGNTTK